MGAGAFAGRDDLGDAYREIAPLDGVAQDQNSPSPGSGSGSVTVYSTSGPPQVSNPTARIATSFAVSG